MKIQKYIFLTCIALGLILTSCRKDDVNQEVVVVNPKGEDKDNNFTIIVNDEDESALADVEVVIGGKTLVTDENGFATLPNTPINTAGQLVTLNKAGYFTNYKRVVPNADDNTFIIAALIKKGSPSASFNAAIGGKIKGNQYIDIQFSQNSIVYDEEQSNYSGQVNVFVHYFNPTDINMYATMPGNLEGIAEDGRNVQLNTFGMALVELEDENGNKLNLKAGTNAELSIALPNSLKAEAPQSIPLWSMDETTGLWVEESSANLENDKYVGEVGHFSFWNCDVPYPLVFLNLQLQTQGGAPIPFTNVLLEVTDSSSVGSSFTNAFGYAAGKVPANELLEVKILDRCGKVYSAGTIGPYVDNNNDEIIKVTIDDEVQFTGTLTKCDGSNVVNGYVSLVGSAGTTTIIPINNGEFSFTGHNCFGDEVVATGFDLDDVKQSEPQTFIIDMTIIDLGILSTCDEPEEFIKFDSDNLNYLFTEVGCEIKGKRVEFFGGNGQDFMSFYLERLANDELEISSIGVIPEFTQLFYSCGSFGAQDCDGLVTLDLTSKATVVGEVYKGDITGSLEFNGDLVPVAIKFKVKLSDIKEKVSGHVWYDVNEDGIRQSSETPLDDVKLELNSNNVRTTFSTDEDGKYEIFTSVITDFDLRIKSTGYFYSPQDIGGDDQIDSDFNEIGGFISNQTINLDEPIEHLDAGLFFTPFICDIKTPAPGCLTGGYILMEVENLPTGNIVKYEISGNVPGLPTTVETSSNPFFFGGVSVGDEITVITSINDIVVCSDVVTVPPVEDMITGFKVLYDSCNSQTGSVYLDVREDELQGLSYLWSNGTTTRDLRNVEEGVYTLVVEDFRGCFQTLTIDVNFGNGHLIGGRVWEETISDGVFSDQDKRLAGMEVRLLNEDGDIIGIDYSDSQGRYWFSNLFDGIYLIQIITEAGQSLVTKDTGTNDNLDSDANPSTGITDQIVLTGGCSIDESIYFGIE